jgi:hypothetical protein
MTRLFAGTPFDIPPRCDRCDQLEESCKCEPLGPERLPANKQTAKVRADRRKHKRMVTVVWGLDAEECPTCYQSSSQLVGAVAVCRVIKLSCRAIMYPESENS